jgi:signal transduction histidine kinase
MILTVLLMAFVVALPAVVGAMAVATLVSHFTAQEVTARLAALVTATDAVRNGNYRTRLPVSGEDEVAALQTNFNMMAEALETSVHAYQAERDRVSGLLQNRRDFILAASHELRTPVSIVRSAAESALSNWPDVPLSAPPDTLRHDLTIIEAEAQRLQALIDDLFALSQADAGRLALRSVPTDLMPVIHNVVSTVAALAWQSSRVRITDQIPDGLPPAMVDANRVQQILHNLLNNGIRHTPPGGIILVEVSRQETHLCIEVKDTGSGISADDLAHIWDHFYRGANAREVGAGLGLALVKDLVTAMDGTVAVESALGHGSCFRVCLPIA